MEVKRSMLGIIAVAMAIALVLAPRNSDALQSDRGYGQDWMILGEYLGTDGDPGVDVMRQDFLQGGGITEATFANSLPTSGQAINTDFGASPASSFDPAPRVFAVPTVIYWVDSDEGVDYDADVFDDTGNCMVYSWTNALNKTGAPLDVRFGVSSDDSFILYLNGTEVMFHEGGRGWGGAGAVQNVSDPVTLNPGNNVVMIKTFQGGGGMGFRCRMQTNDDPAATVANAVPRDQAELLVFESAAGVRSYGATGIYTPSVAIPVTIDLTISGQPASINVTENIPTGWTAQNILASFGSASQSGSQVIWNLGAGASLAETLTYDLLPPGAATGDFQLSGTVVTGIVSNPISGAELLVAANPIGIFDWHGDIGAPPLGQPGGNPSAPGSASLSGTVYTITAAGADIWNPIDRGHLAAADMTGGFALDALAAWSTPIADIENGWAKAGVMVRASVRNDAAAAYTIVRNPENGGLDSGDISIANRPTNGGTWGPSRGPVPEALQPLTVRIVRLGEYTVHYRLDGTTWVYAAGPNPVFQSPDLGPDPVMACLMVTSHQDDGSGNTADPTAVDIVEATFDNVAITATALADMPLREIGVDQAQLGVPIPVTIHLVHQNDANPFLIEETIPDGWVAADISAGGTLAGNVISWSIPLDATTTSVSYTVFASGGGAIGGTFDGFVTDPLIEANIPVAGESSLSGGGVTGGPVAYWPLDEGTGTTAADIIAGQDATLQADATWAAGRFGQAVQIAHTENGGVQAPGGIVNSQVGSVSLWFNTAADFSDQDGMIFSCTEGGGDGFGDQNEIHINMSNEGGAENNVQLWAEGGGSDFNIVNGAILNNGAWHHVVATWVQGGDGVLYVNGAEQARASWTANDFVANETWLGRPSTADPAGNYRPFDGLIDDVRVYDTELSAAQVGDLFNNPPATSAPTPPSNLQASLFAGQVRLTWTDNSNTEDGFVVSRRQGSSGPFIDVAQVGRNRATTFDANVENGETYTYVVRAFNTLGQSANSNEATILVQGGLGATNWSLYE